MRKLTACLFLLLASMLPAQRATRQVTLNWTASTSPGVTGYNIYAGVGAATPTPIGCVGTGNGAVNAAGVAITCVAGTTANTTTFVDTQTIGTTVTYYGTTVAAACPANDTSPTPCGESGPSNSAATVVPPRPTFTTTIVVTVK